MTFVATHCPKLLNISSSRHVAVELLCCTMPSLSLYQSVSTLASQLLNVGVVFAVPYRRASFEFIWDFLAIENR